MNRTLPYLHGGSPEITITVSLKITQKPLEEKVMNESRGTGFPNKHGN